MLYPIDPDAVSEWTPPDGEDMEPKPVFLIGTLTSRQFDAVLPKWAAQERAFERELEQLRDDNPNADEKELISEAILHGGDFGTIGDVVRLMLKGWRNWRRPGSAEDFPFVTERVLLPSLGITADVPTEKTVSTMPLAIRMQFAFEAMGRQRMTGEQEKN